MRLHRLSNRWRRLRFRRVALIFAALPYLFTPAGFAQGFRDYVNIIPGSVIGTQVGPIVYAGNDGGQDGSRPYGTTINFVRLTDDVNENGIPGAIIIADPVTGQLTTMTDFDDLHTFNIAFDQITAQHQSGLRSFDMAAVYWLYEEEVERSDSDARAALETVTNLESLDHSIDESYGTTRKTTAVIAPARLPVVPQFTRFAENRRSGGLGLVYGFRELDVWDRFRFDADGGILGRTYSETNTENWISGPQLGLVAFKRFGPLSLYAHSLLIAGLNEGNIGQNNGIGSELIPGATNRLLYAQPTYSAYNETRDAPLPAGALWAEIGLQVTKNSTVKLAWSALFLDNVFLSDGRTRYYLPDMGLADPGNQNLFVQNVFCGVEVIR